MTINDTLSLRSFGETQTKYVNTTTTTTNNNNNNNNNTNNDVELSSYANIW
jgi:hypothetical protein